MSPPERAELTVPVLWSSDVNPVATEPGQAESDTEIEAQAELKIEAEEKAPESEQGKEVSELQQEKEVPEPEKLQPWLLDFNHAGLNTLVAEALKGSYDLKAAAARMEASRARARISGADRLPEVAASMNAWRDDYGNSLVAAPPKSGMDLALSISWELDLWGKLRNQARAAYHDYEAERARFKAARLSLAVNTARFYFDSIELKRQVTLAMETLESYERTRAVIEDGFRSGIYGALDVRLVRADAAVARRALFLEKKRHDEAVRTLEVFIGRQHGLKKLFIPDTLPEVPLNAVAVGLPSSLISRRPDIIEAQNILFATDERLKKSGKDFLPSITLTGIGQTSSNSMQELLDPDFLISTITAGLVQPLFAGGRLLGRYNVEKAGNKKAVALYAKAVLTAFKEVEVALSAESFLQESEQALLIARDESKEAATIALEEYIDGTLDVTDLLAARRRFSLAGSSLVRVRNERLQNRLNLYLALGGEAGKPEDATVENKKDLKK